jgi:4-hydroxy-3-methylbut-2-enyl diphosphate reductase IspH
LENALRKVRLKSLNYVHIYESSSDISLSSCASCPEAVFDHVLQKLLSFFDKTKSIDSVLEKAIN